MDPFDILGIPPDASDDEIRAAYLARVRECPPDRSPEQFERVRDAFEKVRDPRARIRHRLFAVDPRARLSSVFAGAARPRRFAGLAPWLEVLKRK